MKKIKDMYIKIIKKNKILQKIVPKLKIKCFDQSFQSLFLSIEKYSQED